ncbi:hypothetical protein CDL12_24931 [Handroanthus impetiginosus]|uniref:Uncharacterized protein n=1 Tax=Handroanthus impetiginosus TaxID=429701 RepID=A0A2G9GC37_9LAMI|nr:hypothetical protein CDL12_24931 [Handroanthus impetiginosus]
MANLRLLHSFFILLFFLVIILELASSARPLDVTAFHPARSTNVVFKEKNQNNWSSNEVPEGKQKTKEFIKEYGPSLMNMLPKGRVPASGPSRRINNVNN